MLPADFEESVQERVAVGKILFAIGEFDPEVLSRRIHADDAAFAEDGVVYRITDGNDRYCLLRRCGGDGGAEMRHGADRSGGNGRCGSGGIGSRGRRNRGRGRCAGM